MSNCLFNVSPEEAINSVSSIFPESDIDIISVIIRYFSRDSSFIFETSGVKKTQEKIFFSFAFKKTNNPILSMLIDFEFFLERKNMTMSSKILLTVVFKDEKYLSLINIKEFFEFIKETDNMLPDEDSVLIKTCQYYLNNINLANHQKNIIENIYAYEIIENKLLH